MADRERPRQARADRSPRLTPHNYRKDREDGIRRNGCRRCRHHLSPDDQPLPATGERRHVDARPGEQSGGRLEGYRRPAVRRSGAISPGAAAERADRAAGDRRPHPGEPGAARADLKQLRLDHQNLPQPTAAGPGARKGTRKGARDRRQLGAPMSLEGMDVDQVQQLAQCLSENAQTLSRINAMLATLSAELGHYWQGPSSAAFQQQWAAQYRPALSNAAAALSDLHAHVIANLEQQVQASAAGTGAGSAGLAGPAAPASGLTLGGILGALGGGIAGTWGIASKIEGYVSLATTPFERLEQLSDESTP